MQEKLKTELKIRQQKSALAINASCIRNFNINNNNTNSNNSSTPIVQSLHAAASRVYIGFAYFQALKLTLEKSNNTQPTGTIICLFVCWIVCVQEYWILLNIFVIACLCWCWLWRPLMRKCLQVLMLTLLRAIHAYIQVRVSAWIWSFLIFAVFFIVFFFLLQMLFYAIFIAIFYAPSLLFHSSSIFVPRSVAPLRTQSIYKNIYVPFGCWDKYARIKTCVQTLKVIWAQADSTTTIGGTAG